MNSVTIYMHVVILIYLAPHDVSDSDSLMHHEQLPLVSYKKVDFTSTNSYYGQQLPLEMKIHGR